MPYTPAPSGGGSVAVLDWHPLALASGVTAFGNPYHDPAYAIDAQGYVKLRGLAKIAGAAENMALFTLPEEAWPKKRQLCDLKDANTVTNRTTMIVEPNGVCTITVLGGDGGFTPNFNECGFDLQD